MSEESDKLLDELNKAIEDCPNAYLILGDLDKPFHKPECECDMCEEWRVFKGRRTRKEVRNAKSN